MTSSILYGKVKETPLGEKAYQNNSSFQLKVGYL